MTQPAVDAVARFLLDPEPLTPAMLGVADAQALRDRVGQYLEIGGVQSGVLPTEPQRQRVLALIYGARIVVLEDDVEKFRAEGDVTIERNLLGRITRLETARDTALALAEPASPDGGLAGDFGPYVSGWGVEDGC